MIGIHTVTIDKINVKDPRSITVKGKPQQIWDVGIQINGEDSWYNGAIWDQKHVEPFKKKVGEKVELNFFEEQGKGKYEGRTFVKFKFVNQKNKELGALSAKVDQMQKQIDALLENAGLDKEKIHVEKSVTAEVESDAQDQQPEPDSSEKAMEPPDDLPF